MKITDTPIMEEAIRLYEVRRHRLMQEVTWLKAITRRADANFHHLIHNRRHFANVGRTFVAWESREDGPRIRALLRVESFEITDTTGLRVHLCVSCPETVFDIVVGHQPARVGDLDLWLWMPAYTDVRFVPMNPQHLEGHRILHVQFMTRTRAVATQGLGLCFDTVADFSARWPKHAF